MKNILLFGSTGMLGRYIKDYLSKNGYIVYCIIGINILTLSEYELQRILQHYPNSIIINAIGLIPHTKNTDHSQYIKINGEFPKLIDKYMTYDQKFIHITTDCVYDGSLGEYTESHVNNSIDIYGISKTFGEDLINATIIRSSIIGEQNYKVKGNYSLLEWIKHQKTPIPGYTNHYWNGITCLKMSEIILDIIQKNLYWIGIRHIYIHKYI